MTKVIIEVEGVIKEVISEKTYRVELTSADYEGKEVIAKACGALYYNGIQLYKNEHVVLDLNTSDPQIGTITYRL